MQFRNLIMLPESGSCGRCLDISLVQLIRPYHFSLFYTALIFLELLSNGRCHADLSVLRGNMSSMQMITENEVKY